VSYSTKQHTLHLYHTLYRFFIRPHSYPIPLSKVRHSNMHKQPPATSCSQPTARVANQNRRRRDIAQDNRAARSGTQLTLSGSTHSPHCGARKCSPLRIVRRLLAPPAKLPRRDTLDTVAYNDHRGDQDEDGQQIREIFHLSDDSSDVYQNSHISDQTKLDTEPDPDENDNVDGTRSITGHQSQAGEKRTNNRVLTVRNSTTSGSQEAAIVRCTPAAQVRIIRSSAYTPPTISTSGVSRYSSMATHRATTSAVQRSSPRGEQGMPGHEHIWPETNSRCNTAMGAERGVVGRAKGLILLYTLFHEPLPGPVALTTQVHSVWLQGLNHISDAGNIEASEESVKLVSRHQPILEESFRRLD